jgi:2-hydroxy-3-oxopropionate reductase
MSERVGFIGLGIMGRPMALNLLKAGYPVAVYARRPESLEPLETAGAETCRSPAELAARSDLVFTMVSDTPDVEEVLFGPGGAIEGVREGTVVVDMSTISPAVTRDMARRLAALGVAMLDAPVSGGEVGAIDGTLSIMVGGEPEVFERVLPLLRVLGENIVHIGDQGAGQVCKACNQVVVGATIAGVAEAVLLARASGVDPGRVREALLGGFAGSRILEVHGRRMIEGDFAPGFKSRLHQKDMGIVLETAQELGLALPGAAQVAQYLNALVGRGLGEEDSAAIYRVLAALGGASAAQESARSKG